MFFTEIEKAGDGGIMMKRKTVKLLLSVFLIFMVSAFTYGFDALADIPTVKGEGTLTSIEDDGTVIIDEKGYGLDPSATIMDRKGKSVSIKKLSLPAKVRFEYRYAEKGFIIVFIGEIKEKGDSPRRRR
jgi:hypothetical protein